MIRRINIMLGNYLLPYLITHSIVHDKGFQITDAIHYLEKGQNIKQLNDFLQSDIIIQYIRKFIKKIKFTLVQKLPKVHSGSNIKTKHIKSIDKLQKFFKEHHIIIHDHYQLYFEKNGIRLYEIPDVIIYTLLGLMFVSQEENLSQHSKGGRKTHRKTHRKI